MKYTATAKVHMAHAAQAMDEATKSLKLALADVTDEFEHAVLTFLTSTNQANAEYCRATAEGSDA